MNKQPKLTSFEVQGLHHRFDRQIEFSEDANLLIITAPNGFGKTAFIDLIEAILTSNWTPLYKIPFTKIVARFSDGTEIVARKHLATEVESDFDGQISIDLNRDGQTYRLNDALDDSFSGAHVPISLIDEYVPYLTRVGANKWVDVRTNNILNRQQASQLAIRYAGLKSPDLFSKTSPEFSKFLESVSCYKISAQRTIYEKPGSGVRRYKEEREFIYGVSERAEEIANRIKDALNEFAIISQRLDSTFPNRLLANIAKKAKVRRLEELEHALDLLEQRRGEFSLVRLISNDLNPIKIPSSEQENSVLARVLDVYINDSNQKLDSIGNIQKKISLFISLLNEKFRYKRVEINEAREIVVTSENGGILAITDLSSGEQHEFILVFDLIFRCSSNSVVLIDEPEISLHIGWQVRFLSDLEKIAELNNFRAIVATHSPQIINDRWDHVVEFVG